MSQIEPGWYSFRVVATNNKQELQVFNSWKKYAADYEQLKENKQEYLDYLINTSGVKDLRVTHTIPEIAPGVNQDDWYLD